MDTTPVSAATVTASSVAPSSSPVKLVMAVVAGARAHARAPADVAAEVVGLGERPLGARRGDLQRVALAHLGQQLGDALAQLERDALRMVDEQAHELAAHHLGEQHLDLGLGVCQPGLDVGLYRAHDSSLSNKKAGERPLSRHDPPGPRKLS